MTAAVYESLFVLAHRVMAIHKWHMMIIGGNKVSDTLKGLVCGEESTSHSLVKQINFMDKWLEITDNEHSSKPTLPEFEDLNGQDEHDVHEHSYLVLYRIGQFINVMDNMVVCEKT